VRPWPDYGSSTDAQRVKHGYDRAGNRLWRETPVAAAAGKHFDEFYTYDGIYQLANLDRGDHHRENVDRAWQA